MRYRKALDGRDAHITTLRGAIVILVGVLAYSLHGWSKSPERITIDLPPDLSAGASVKVGERNPAAVYAFSNYIFQQLGTWAVDGREEYPKRIEELSCYLSPRFKQDLLNDYEKKAKRNELSRTRSVTQMIGRGYEPRRVWIESPETWVSFHDVRVFETFRGETVKDIYARYPLRVRAFNNNPECNPWALVLDGMYDTPKRLDGSYAEADVQNLSGAEAKSE